MSYSRSYKSSSYRFATDDDGPSSFTTSSSRYSSNLGRDNISSSLNRSSLLGDLDSSLLSSSSTRKKLRSDYDNTTSFDYGHATVSGSGYGSSRRFESTGALSNYGREVASSSLLSRKNYLEDEDDDYTEKYSPRRLDMLTGRQQSSSSNAYKKYLDDDDDDNDISISSSVYKKTRYNKADDFEDKDESYSIRNIRKHSTSSNTSYLKDDFDQFYSELISKTSSRYKNKKDDDYDSKDEDFQTTSRFSNKQSSREDRKSILEDEYMPSSSSMLKNYSRLSSKEDSSSNVKPASRFLSKYSSRDEPLDDEIESTRYLSNQKKSYSSRFNSREDLNKEEDSINSKDFTSRYKKYSRQESAGATSILSERSVNLPESRLESKSEKKIETKSFSSSSYKASRLYEDSDGFSQNNVTSTSLETKTSFLDKENQSKSYLEDENSTLDAKESAYYVIIDYSPPKSSPDEIPLKEGQRVTVLSKDKPNKWRIQTHNFKDIVGTVGFAPSCYLEPLEDAIPGLSKDSSSKDSSGKSYSVQQAEKKRKTIIKELVETEEDFNRDMQFIANTYLKHMESSLMPKELRDNRCELYNYFRQIADFHNNELSEAIQFYSQEETKNIESAFLRMEREFDLHVAYCRDLPEVQQMLKEGPFKEYFDNYSSKIKDDKKLEDHLKLPVQRINDYQLLIKELIKYTARLNENTKDLEKALEMMQAIPQRANDLQFIQSIQGYRGNLHDTGRLLKQDWFKVIGNDNKAQDRYCILFKQKLLITDQQNAGQGKKIYFIKNLFKLNEIKSSSEDDELTIVLNRKGGEITSDLPIKLIAYSSEQKTKWLDEIHNCRQLTREELADEREPEFTIVEDESKKSFSRRDSLDSNKSLNLLNKKNEAVLEDKLITVIKLEEPKKEEEDTSLNSLKKSVSKQSLNSTSFSRKNSLKADDSENNDNNKEDTLVRKPSKDIPEGLPKPQKTEQKLNGLSRQSSKQDLNRKLSVSSNAENNEPTLSRQNSSLENKSSSKLSSRKNSVDKPNSESASLSRKNSSMDDKLESPTEKKSLSRESSRKSSFAKRQESKVLEDFEVYEESKSVPLINEESPNRKIIWSENGEKPKFKKELKDLKVNFNETIILECELEPINEKVVLEWLKDNKVLNIAGRYKSSNEGNIYTLQINKAIVRDSGIFALTATSPYAQAITTANVIVKPLERQDSRPSTPGGTILPHAPIFKIKLKDTDLLENSTIRFELLVSGEPAPKIEFFKDEKPLKESDRIKIEYSSKDAFEIIIENVKPSDAGHYRVLAQNSEGTDSTSCNLTVSSDKDVFKGLVENEDEPELLSPNLEKNESLSRKSSNSNSRPRTPLFKWFKDGNEFNASDRFSCQFNEDEDTIGLIFQHVTPEDAGLYTCVAKTGTMNKISCSAELTVQGEINRLLRDPEPPKFLDSLKDSTVSKGSTATIEVKVTGYPKPVISWIHDDQEIKFPSDKHKLLYEDDDTMTLIIKNAQPEDAGTYQLVAKNELGEISDDCKLTVQSPPKFLQKLDDQNVLKNKPFELTVKIQSSPEPEVQWLKNDKPLSKENSPNIKFECKKDGDVYTFTAKCDSADFADSGSYSVVTQLTVPNDYAQQSCKCSVNVNSEPEISGFKNFAGNENDNLEMKFKISGSPKPTVQLFKNDKPIDLSVEKNINLIDEGNDSYKLIFPKLTKDQCAKYTLVAKNEFGEKKADARLDIKSKPEFTQKLSDLAGKEGENANLVVKIKSFPAPDIVFKFNDKPIDLKNKDKYNLKVNDDGTVTLEIKDLKQSDAGKYSVEVKNSEGKIESDCKLQVNSLPKFTLPLKNVVINENEKLILKVKYSGSPKPELTWFKNDKKLKTDDKRIKISEKTDDKGETECELIITGSVSTDSAKYKCKAKNISGEVSTECDALVSAMPIFVQGMTNVDATEGQKDVEFSVKLKRQPNEPTIKWFLGDLPVTEEDGRFTLIKANRNKEPVTEEDGDEYKLIIKTATTDLASMVKCEARNQFGVSECYASFTVKKIPCFIEKLENVKYGEINKTIKIQVKASGFPKPNLKWKRNNIEEEFTSATIILKENCVSEKGEDIVTNILEIKSLTSDLCGEFECVASNEMGEVITKGKIQIGTKPKVLKDLENVSGNIGDKIELEFKALGEPMPDFTWYKDGKKIDNDNNFTIEKKDDGTCKLSINLTDPNLEGKYHVVAKNPVGETESKKINLSVVDPSKNKDKKNKSDLDDDNKDKKEDEDRDKRNKSELDDENKNKNDDKNKRMGKAIDSFDADVKDSKIPKIHDLTDVGVKIGEPITLLAFVTGKPEAEVNWFKSGVSINSTDNIVLLKGEDAFNNLDNNTKNYIKSNPNKGVLHTLTVKKVVEDNLGDYTLKATNKYGEAEKTVEMQMKSTSPIFLSELPNSLKVKEGTKLRLEAKIDGNPTPCVKWFKNGREIVTNNLNDQLNRLTDPSLSTNDDVDNKNINSRNNRKESFASSKEPSFEKHRSRKESLVSVGSSNGDKKLKRLTSQSKSIDDSNQHSDNNLLMNKSNVSSDVADLYSSNKAVGGGDHIPNYCVSSNDIFINDRIKIENFANGVCILTIDKAKDEDEGIYTIMAVNKNAQATSNCKVNVVSKYYREYSPPASVKHKMQSDPNYKPPMEWGLKGRKPNEHFDFKSETSYQIGSDTYVLQYRDTSFPLRIREYLRIGSARSPSLASNLKEGHWGYSHPDTGFYPSVSVRERRKFTDVMDEEIKDEKTGETIRKQPLRLIREIPTSGRGYGQVVTLRSEVARADSKEEADEDNSPIITDPQKQNIEAENTEAKSLVKKRKLKTILKSEIPFFREKIKDTTANEEETVKFKCFAVGDPNPGYTWFKNDHLLMDDTKITIHYNSDGRSELEIRDVNEYDYGRYKCLARNDHGAVVCQAILKPPNHIISIPNEDTQIELDYLIETDSIRKKAILKEEELYTFNNILFKGKYSLVLKGTEKIANKQVVCKAVLDKDLQESGFNNELKILTTLCHERIVLLSSAARFNGINVIAMEQLSGINVITYLSLQPTYTEALITKIISQVTDAIEYLHFRGIALLEMQPDNVVMVNASQPFIKLVDFSNARYVSSKGEDGIEIKGNEAYLAPEILLKQRITYAADIWCIGVLSYILLSGHNPFAGETEKETKDNVCFVRFNYNQVFKQTSQEAIRFLMFIFKKDAEKRPKIEEVQNNKWLFCDENLIKKREAVIFSGTLLNAFSLEFHSEKERNSPDELAKICGV